MNAHADTMVKHTGLVVTMWLCLVLGWGVLLLPIPLVSTLLGFGLELVAFILAIMLIVRQRKLHGVLGLLASVVITPIVYLVGIVVLAAALSAAGGESTRQAGGKDASQSATQAPATAAEEVIEIAAPALQAAYEKNEIAADQQYKGKPLRVTGVVNSIDSDMDDEPVVVLVGDGYFSNVRAAGVAKDVAATLGKGQSVTLRCTGDGEILGSPSLANCTIE